MLRAHLLSPYSFLFPYSCRFPRSSVSLHKLNLEWILPVLLLSIKRLLIRANCWRTTDGLVGMLTNGRFCSTNKLSSLEVIHLSVDKQNRQTASLAGVSEDRQTASSVNIPWGRQSNRLDYRSTGTTFSNWIMQRPPHCNCYRWKGGVCWINALFKLRVSTSKFLWFCNLFSFQ